MIDSVGASTVCTNTQDDSLWTVSGTFSGFCRQLTSTGMNCSMSRLPTTSMHLVMAATAASFTAWRALPWEGEGGREGRFSKCP